MSKVKITKNGILIEKSNNEKISLYKNNDLFYFCIIKFNNQIIMELDKEDIELMSSFIDSFVGKSILFDIDMTSENVEGFDTVNNTMTDKDINYLFRNILNKKDT